MEHRANEFSLAFFFSSQSFAQFAVILKNVIEMPKKKRSKGIADNEA